MTITKKTFSAVAAFISVLAAAILMVCATPSASAATITGKTSKQITAEIGTGWILGNSLDATGSGNSLYSETSWGNPKTTKAMIDAVKAQGFNTVRVPVSWGNHTTGDNFTIDSQWLARVKEVVDYCIDNDMYVILNIHHDTSTQYYYPSSTYKTQSVKFVKSIWTQVAKYFKNYDQKLIFETLNEPRLVGTGDEWWFPVNNPNSAVLDSINVINTLNQTAVDTIRAAGGKNTDRCIMVPGYDASIDGCTTSTFKLPNDSTPDRLIVSVHAYTPYNFALNANGTAEFKDDMKNEVDYLYSTIKSHFIDKGIPAIIGETSASNKNNTAERVKWAQYYMGKSAEYGVPCILWDNNAFNGSDKGECHGHLNRSTLGWYDKTFVDAVIKYGKKGITPAPSSASSSAPSAVTGFSKKSSTVTSITLKWNKNTTADGYIIERYDGAKWVRLKKITSNSTTSLSINSLKASTVYKFRIKAYKMNGSTALYSNYSSTVAIRTNPSVITGAKLGGRAADALRVNWTMNSSADGYIIEMYQSNKWIRVAKITNNSTTTFRKAGLKASTVYKFRVRAYKMSGSTALYGNYSATVTARTNPSIMKGVKIGGKAKDALRVNWTKNTSAQGYIVEMYRGNKWVRVAKITNNSTTTFRKAGLARNTTYKFRVRAYHMSGNTPLYGNYGSISGKTAAK